MRGLEHLFLEESPGQGRVSLRAGNVASSGFPQELHPRGSEGASATSGNSAGKGLGANKSQSVLHISAEMWAPALIQDSLQKPAWWPAG